MIFSLEVPVQAPGLSIFGLAFAFLSGQASVGPELPIMRKLFIRPQLVKAKPIVAFRIPASL